MGAPPPRHRFSRHRFYDVVNAIDIDPNQHPCFGGRSTVAHPLTDQSGSLEAGIGSLDAPAEDSRRRRLTSLRIYRGDLQVANLTVCQARSRHVDSVCSFVAIGFLLPRVGVAERNVHHLLSFPPVATIGWGPKPTVISGEYLAGETLCVRGPKHRMLHIPLNSI